MDWFEQLTGFDPDASTGTFEALLATAVAVAIVAIAFAILARRRTTTAR